MNKVEVCTRFQIVTCIHAFAKVITCFLCHNSQLVQELSEDRVWRKCTFKKLLIKSKHSNNMKFLILSSDRVAELGSLSSGAKMEMKIFIKRVFTIFASNASFFARNRKFAKLTQWNMQYIPCNNALLAQETLFLAQRAPFLAKVFQKVRKLRQILISQQNCVS